MRRSDPSDTITLVNNEPTPRPSNPHVDAANPDSLLADAVEQAMRISSDESAVMRIAFNPIGTAARLAALGSLLGDDTFPLMSSTPLVVWCNGGSVDPAWRRFFEPADNSLYATLEMLRLLTPAEVTPAPRHCLEELRARRLLLDRRW